MVMVLPGFVIENLEPQEWCLLVRLPGTQLGRGIYCNWLLTALTIRTNHSIQHSHTRLTSTSNAGYGHRLLFNEIFSNPNNKPVAS